GVADLRGVVTPLAVGRPGVGVAALAVAGAPLVDGLDHAAVAAAVPQLAQAGAVGANQVGVAVVVLAREVRHPLAGGRPDGNEVERVGVLHRLGVLAVAVGEGEAVVWGVTNPF